MDFDCNITTSTKLDGSFWPKHLSFDPWDTPAARLIPKYKRTSSTIYMIIVLGHYLTQIRLEISGPYSPWIQSLQKSFLARWM